MMSQQSALVTVPDEVGRLYDRFTALGAATLGDNLHFGYWDTPDSEVGLDEAADRLTDLMTEKLKVNAQSRVLDIGCGVGGPGVRIARLTGARVTGISVSHKQITLANSYAESAGLAERVTFQRANAMELPFPAQSFDAAIALESIIHMPDRGQVLRQISRTLRPGGRLVLTDFFERVPIPTAKQSAVDRYLNDFMMTMVQAEDYPPLLRQAELLFDEIVDISERTLRKTFVMLSTRINQTREDLKSKLGDNMVDQFDPTNMIDIAGFGYLMVVAKRPEKGISQDWRG
jgi:cyclopropane fatty-acyl-phospholipid synthase-like methyltransferase